MSKTTKRWHDFRDTEDGDDQCRRCAVVVSLEAHITFTHPCPVPACTSSKNPDEGCLFAPAKEGPCRCIYCGASGDRDHETDADEDLEPGVGDLSDEDLAASRL